MHVPGSAPSVTTLPTVPGVADEVTWASRWWPLTWSLTLDAQAFGADKPTSLADIKVCEQREKELMASH